MKQVVLRNRLLASSIYAAIAGTALLPQVVNAHGYIQDPPSRDFNCQLLVNLNCGQAQYEPQSAGELLEGFPASGPVDGTIIGGDGMFSALNEQAANRWHLMQLDKHEIEFKWHYIVGHVTRGWEYFITKNDWNPNAPLTRASFDLTPFCSFDGQNKEAHDPSQPKHTCAIPSDRSGHHVILGVWTVGDTDKAFYKAIDVDIKVDGGPAPEWRQVSSINPHRNLKLGDKVTARAFIGGAESAEYSASISIDNIQDGIAENWSYKLANKINATQTLISAGRKDAEGNIAPQRGPNIIYAKQESGVSNYEFAFEGSPEDAYMHQHGLKPEYVLKDGEATVDFSVMTNRDLKVRATLFDANNKQVGFQALDVNSATVPFALKATSGEGKHVLKLVGRNKDDKVLLQQEHELELIVREGGDYQYTFPESVGSYQAGDKVFQPKTGEIYECKPFPYSGYCNQWSPSATQFEPGTGSNWTMAWDLR
ncbi:N-acetylglucosamine-binding protein GbpA [Pseudomonas sp. NPDC089554]|uniref:N-acetylglucosamine-binding protein GbpA n=1 Tax=Pseudomonas sp. NPDC089554 TaxID=3390653 RepID=UPI003D0864E2